MKHILVKKISDHNSDDRYYNPIETESMNPGGDPTAVGIDGAGSSSMKDAPPTESGRKVTLYKKNLYQYLWDMMHRDTPDKNQGVVEMNKNRGPDPDNARELLSHKEIRVVGAEDFRIMVDDHWDRYLQSSLIPSLDKVQDAVERESIVDTLLQIIELIDVLKQHEGEVLFPGMWILLYHNTKDKIIPLAKSPTQDEKTEKRFWENYYADSWVRGIGKGDIGKEKVFMDVGMDYYIKQIRERANKYLQGRSQSSLSYTPSAPGIQGGRKGRRIIKAAGVFKMFDSIRYVDLYAERPGEEPRVYEGTFMRDIGNGKVVVLTKGQFKQILESQIVSREPVEEVV